MSYTTPHAKQAQKDNGRATRIFVLRARYKRHLARSTSTTQEPYSGCYRRGDRCSRGAQSKRYVPNWRSLAAILSPAYWRGKTSPVLAAFYNSTLDAI